MNGDIVWFSESGAYGFIRPLDGGPDIVFCARQSVTPDLGEVRVGLAVHYTVRRDDRGPIAHRIAPGHLDDDSL
ncbi:MAG: hypothetical protein CMM46_02725 [Rhodospirillaceae bacterium]|nr:hypothetical protein [Rhodospirillaceae bacterium]|tara:strand:- start:708 stop:929 length:222 start_codon:yes stop_codon:yes gene_type:complete